MCISLKVTTDSDIHAPLFLNTLSSMDTEETPEISITIVVYIDYFDDKSLISFYLNLIFVLEDPFIVIGLK